MRRRWIPNCLHCLLALGVLLCAPAVHAQGEVELVEAGTAPHRPLRHRFRAGQRQSLRLRIQSRMHIEAAGREQSVVVPAMVIDLGLGPTRVTSEGNLRYRFEVEGLSASGGEAAARAQIEEQLSALVGTSGTAEIDERGRSVRFDYALPDSVPEQIRQQAESLRSSLAELLPRFPREPVGVGAVWRIEDTLRMPQMEVRMATVYRLRRWEGDAIELSVTIESGEGQVPEGVEVDIGGNGRQRFELGSLVVDARVLSDADMQVQSPRGEMRIRMQTRTEVRPGDGD